MLSRLSSPSEVDTVREAIRRNATALDLLEQLTSSDPNDIEEQQAAYALTDSIIGKLENAPEIFQPDVLDKLPNIEAPYGFTDSVKKYGLQNVIENCLLEEHLEMAQELVLWSRSLNDFYSSSDGIEIVEAVSTLSSNFNNSRSTSQLRSRTSSTSSSIISPLGNQESDSWNFNLNPHIGDEDLDYNFDFDLPDEPVEQRDFDISPPPYSSPIGSINQSPPLNPSQFPLDNDDSITIQPQPISAQDLEANLDDMEAFEISQRVESDEDIRVFSPVNDIHEQPAQFSPPLRPFEEIYDNYEELQNLERESMDEHLRDLLFDRPSNNELIRNYNLYPDYQVERDLVNPNTPAEENEYNDNNWGNLSPLPRENNTSPVNYPIPLDNQYFPNTPLSPTEKKNIFSPITDLNNSPLTPDITNTKHHSRRSSSFGDVWKERMGKKLIKWGQELIANDDEAVTSALIDDDDDDDDVTILADGYENHRVRGNDSPDLSGNVYELDGNRFTRVNR